MHYRNKLFIIIIIIIIYYYYTKVRYTLSLRNSTRACSDHLTYTELTRLA